MDKDIDYQDVFEFLGIPEDFVTAAMTVALAILVGAILGYKRIGKLETPAFHGRDRVKFGVGAAIAMLVLTVLGNDRAFQDGKIFFIASVERETEIRAQCEGFQAIAIEPAQVTTFHGNYSFFEENSIAKTTDRSRRCRARFAVEWKAKGEHFFFVPDEQDLLTVRFISGGNRHGYTRGPYGVSVKFQGKSGRAYSAIGAEGFANAPSSMRSKTCGAQIELNAVQLPNACLSRLK